MVSESVGGVAGITDTRRSGGFDLFFLLPVLSTRSGQLISPMVTPV